MADGPVVVTVVGNDGLVKGTQAVTPPDQPNIVLNVVPKAVAIVVRTAHLYGVTFAGMLGAGTMTPEGQRLLYTADFAHLVLTCASLSMPIAIVGLVKDLVTVLGKLEEKYPLLTGGV